MQQIPTLVEAADPGRVRGGHPLGHPLAASGAGQQALAAELRARQMVDLAGARPAEPLALSSYPLPVQREQGWPPSSACQQGLGGQPGASVLLPGAWRTCLAQADAAGESLARSQAGRGVQQRPSAAMLPHPFAAAAGPAWGGQGNQWAAARPRHLGGREDCPPQSAASSCSEPSPPNSLATSTRKRGRGDWADDLSQRARSQQVAAAAALPAGAMGQQPLPLKPPQGYYAQQQSLQLPGRDSQHMKLELAVAQLRPHPAELAWACRAYADCYRRKRRGEPWASLPKSALSILQAQLLCVLTAHSLQQHGSGRSEQMTLGPYG